MNNAQKLENHHAALKEVSNDVDVNTFLRVAEESLTEKKARLLELKKRMDIGLRQARRLARSAKLRYALSRFFERLGNVLDMLSKSVIFEPKMRRLLFYLLAIVSWIYLVGSASANAKSDINDVESSFPYASIVTHDLRPARFKVEYSDSKRVPAFIAELRTKEGEWPTMKLLGDNGTDYVLLSQRNKRVFFVDMHNVTLIGETLNIR